MALVQKRRHYCLPQAPHLKSRSQNGYTAVAGGGEGGGEGAAGQSRDAEGYTHLHIGQTKHC
jgi:hypothetical protein